MLRLKILLIKKLIAFISLALVAFLLLACSSSSKIKIQSSPSEAEIIVKSSDGQSKTLGHTPLTIESSTLYPTGMEMAELSLTKEGYETQNIFLSSSNSQELYDIAVRLKKNPVDLKLSDARNRQDKLAQGIAKANNFISTKRFDEALSLLNNLVQNYDDISVCHDLLGNIHYLQKNFKQALFHYEKSFQINPENNETKQIIQKLKGIIN